MYIDFILVFFLLTICILLFFFLSSHIWAMIVGGIPYLPTHNERVKQMISLAKIQPGEKAAELGSGDGRIVIALARAGAEAHGYEINVFYVLLAKWNIYRAGLKNKAFVHWKNFWYVNISSYDIITAYGISYVMDKLEKKLKKEIKSSTRVITTSYRFKTWNYIQRKDYVFLYKK